MNAEICFKSKRIQEVKNLKEITYMSILDEEHVTDFKTFTLDKYNYTFIGDNIVTANGADIEYINFQN